MSTPARLVVGASGQTPDIRWLTKFFAPDPFVAVEIGGRKIMVAYRLEYGRAHSEARVDEVISVEDLPGNQGGQLIPLKEQALLLLQSCGAGSALISGNFPAVIYQHLLDNGITLKFQNPLFPERSVKDVSELEDIRYAQRATEEAFATLMDILGNASIRSGKLWNRGAKKFLTSEDLRAVFEGELLAKNCMCPDGTIIASGDQAVDPHCDGYGPILANSPIVLDLYPQSRAQGYWSDMSRTVVKGKISAEARKMYRAVYEVQQRALETVRPGTKFRDIQLFAVKCFEEQGFRTFSAGDKYQGFFHGIGHGVGLEIHELPSPNKADNSILQVGNVITIEPGLYYLGIGGVRIEDTIVVTEHGYENLATLPKELLEIP